MAFEAIGPKDLFLSGWTRRGKGLVGDVLHRARQAGAHWRSGWHSRSAAVMLMSVQRDPICPAHARAQCWSVVLMHPQGNAACPTIRVSKAP